MYKLRGALETNTLLKCETSSQAGQEQMFLIIHWPALSLFVLFKLFMFYEKKGGEIKMLKKKKNCRLVRFERLSL